jgi:hypothetical protein
MFEQTRARRRRAFLAACSLLCGLGVAGCGSSSATVTGTISHKGKLLRGGTITFYGANNWTGSSHINEDGTYRIEKVPTGTVHIAVETKTAKPNPMMSKMPKPPKDAPVPKGSMYDTEGQADRYVAIPDKYGDKEKSGLTYEVKSGTQEHKIDLTE